MQPQYLHKTGVKNAAFFDVWIYMFGWCWQRKCPKSVFKTPHEIQRNCLATSLVHSWVKNNPVTQTNVMTLLKGKSVCIAEGKSNEKQMHMERILSEMVCGFTLGTCFSSTWGEGVYIAMQRKILAVEKCVCYGGKRSFKGKVSRWKSKFWKSQESIECLNYK